MVNNGKLIRPPRNFVHRSISQRLPLPSRNHAKRYNVVGYYPSGSKQEAGFRLDRMVELERTAAARDIVAYLRTKTGEDLGTSPEAWIQKYAKR